MRWELYAYRSLSSTTTAISHSSSPLQRWLFIPSVTVAFWVENVALMVLLLSILEEYRTNSQFNGTVFLRVCVCVCLCVCVCVCVCVFPNNSPCLRMSQWFYHSLRDNQ